MASTATKSIGKERNQNQETEKPDLAEKAQEGVGTLAEMASDAVTAIGQGADSIAENAGHGIRGLGDMLEKNAPQEGMIGSASHTVAETLRESGKYVEEAKLSGISDDLTHVIQRNPFASVLVGLGVGYLLGCALRR